MELTYEGKRYKSITISTVDSICFNDFSEDWANYRYIADCRNVNTEDIITKLASFCHLIEDERVSYAWLNCSRAKFLEIKERLRKLMAENRNTSSLSKDLTVLKLTKHGQQVTEIEALKISIDVMNFGKNLLDVHHVMEAHPGLLHETIHADAESPKKKRKADDGNTDSVVTSAAYRDRRRPKKRVFKALKKMIQERPVDVSQNKPCYMCNSKVAFVNLCDGCLKLNGEMKNALCDLQGRYAIVTGGRIKIGFETSLRLLRDGCSVIVTTRFPVDAAVRFSKEKDFDAWKHRLKIIHLDLQNMASIQEFLEYVQHNIPHLDILVNNAAQTIFKPYPYYETLIAGEVKNLPCLSKGASKLIVDKSQKQLDQLLFSCKASSSPLALDCGVNSNEFPLGQKDEHGEQIDLRVRNSWTYNLDEVPLQELLQVLTINAVGPFILTAKLKPLLKQSPFPRRFVVNVSAMEGQFSRVTKGHRHPHTNMAKAALNMMTRTSGLEFQMDGIYMTAVDTGWVTDERPFHQARHEADVKGFLPPLDCKDGAARVYHPIVHGLNPGNTPYFAVFLKDFRPKSW